MRLAYGSTERKFTGLVIIILLLVNTFLAAFMVESVSAAPFQSKLTLKWSTSVGSNGRTQGGPLVADINGDGKMEVVVTGAVVTSTGWTTNGSISCLDGATGKILWKDDGTNITNIGVDPRTPFDFADLLGDGKLEIVVYSYSGPLVLFPNGTVYWRRMDVTADANYGAIADVNGDGHPEIFTCGGETPFMTSGTDHIAELTYDGTLLHETPSWHPCFGGLSIADIDGHWILFEGDRSASYSGDNDSQKGGGWGVRALDAQTLTPMWNDSDILCSSQCPVLADVTGQGQLEVVIAMQTNKGFAVLNATNGSVITDWNGTGGYIYRKGAAGQGLSSHSQLTVGDFDGDGHLEAVVDGQGTPAKIWDLYDWKLDYILPITCWEPPGAGYVTADGKLDLVAVNASGKDIHIYSFDKNANAYVEVDNITTGIDGANAFTVVQDVDGDGYNELVVSGYTGWVYCYDTPAKAANPKPRSGLQFYSEYKRRVAEYVPPAGPQGLVISNPSPGDKGSNIPIKLSQLSFSLTDLQENLMNYSVTTSPDIGSGSGTNKLNGIYSISVSNLSYNTTYTWTVTATDGQNNVSSTFTFQTISLSPWWNNSWHYRRIISIDPSKVSGNQTDFPIVIDLTDNSLTSKAQANGNDFVFVDANNNKLSHEIEQYDNTTGHLIVWVKVPFLSTSTNTILFMYYGNPTCGNQQNSTSVWDSSNRMVLHLDEKTGQQNDSTANGNNGTPISGITQGVLGEIDGADTFNGVNGYVQVADSNTLSGFTQAFTASFWLRLDDITRRQAILNKFNTVTNQEGWFIEYNNNLGLFVSQDGSTYSEWHAPFAPTAGTWYYITVVWQSNATPQFYVNGVQATTTGASKIVSIYNNVGVPLYIGRCAYNSGRYLKGGLDEIHISNPARSPGWILTSYNNQQNPATFNSIGQEEAMPTGPPPVLTVNVIGSGNVSRNDTGPYTYGSAVQLTATPDSGWVFQNWTGDLTGSANPATVVMTGDKTVIATFTNQSTGPAWWNSSWQYRRPITINHQKVSADQTNFPVVIDFTDSSLTSKAQANGNDFVFVDANNNKLSHEIEQYDNTTGHLVVWVNVLALSSTVDTVLYSYYGNPSCPSQQNKTAVWDANYLAVMHLDENNGTQYDSTINQNNGTPTSPLTQGASGKVDGADDFPGGSTGGYVQSTRVCTTQNQFTFSAWIYPRSGARYIISEWSTNNQGAFLQISANNVVQFYVNGLYVQMPVSLSQWHYVVGTFNGTSLQLWVDGGSPVSVSGSAPIWPSQSLFVGDRNDHLRKFNGLIDEVRVSNVSRSNGWVNTEYNNQNSPSTFYTIGTEETVH